MEVPVTSSVKSIQPSQIVSFLNCNVAKASALAPLFNKVLPAYGINTPLRVQHSLSQMAHESQHFRRYSENLNYSAAGLKNTWSERFPNDTVANQFARHPQKIAEKVYDGRMGNDKPDDGWLLRGSGAIQITGKDNISAYAKFKGITDIYETARLMRETDEYAIDSACWFLAVRVKTLEAMDRDDIVAVTRRVNGGLIGLADRKHLLARAKKIFL